MSRRHPAATALVVALTSILLVTPGATADQVRAAGGADAIVTSGSCAGGGTWLMAARAKKGGIAVTVRIDAGRPGQIWRGALTHNGRLLGQRARPVTGRGVAVISVRTPNLPGVDSYVFTARNPSTRATCTGSLSY